MAAFIPSRKDPAVNEKALAKVRDDKEREANDGFDGTWVAHPDLVSVAKEEFDKVLKDRANQVARLRDEVSVSAGELLDTHVPDGAVTDEGVHSNVSVAILYLESWLRGTGAAALFNLMEDAATAEIARSQIWQWVRHGVSTSGGARVDKKLVHEAEEEELGRIREVVGDETYEGGRFKDAIAVFEEVALAKEMPEFLTIPAYELLD
jgi:malate synthase